MFVSLEAITFKIFMSISVETVSMPSEMFILNLKKIHSYHEFQQQVFDKFYEINIFFAGVGRNQTEGCGRGNHSPCVQHTAGVKRPRNRKSHQRGEKEAQTTQVFRQENRFHLNPENRSIPRPGGRIRSGLKKNKFQFHFKNQGYILKNF